MNDFHPDFPASVIEFSETAARKAINNTLPACFLPNAMRLSNVLGMINDRVKVVYAGRHLTVTSGYRCPALNQEVGGVVGSDHLLGLAADLQVSGVSVPELAGFIERALEDTKTPFHQLINEYGRWVHVGLAKQTVPPSYEKLSAIKYAGPNGKVSTIWRKVTSFKEVA